MHILLILFNALLIKGYSDIILTKIFKQYKIKKQNRMILMYKLKTARVKIICRNPREIYFNMIKTNIVMNTRSSHLSKIKTKKGETQSSERTSISIVRNTLDKLKCSYKEAGSQESKDFQNIQGIGLNIEVKKTDSSTVYFNDTLPSSDIYYIIMFTGNKKYPPQMIFINGYHLIKDDIYYLLEYKQIMENLKNEWARKTYSKDNKANKLKHFSVYPRPTFRTSIEHLLGSELSYVLGEEELHCRSE
jgi:hypothetical protein